MEEDAAEILKILPFLVPLLILQLVLMIVALLDLVRRERVRGNNKILWAVIIVFLNLIGPIIYLLAGRMEGPDGSDRD